VNNKTLEIADVCELVREGLGRVEQELARQSGSGIEPVAEIARYLQSGGGKRLRPALHLLQKGFHSRAARDAFRPRVVQKPSAPIARGSWKSSALKTTPKLSGTRSETAW